MKAKKNDKVATNMCKQAKISYKIKYVKCNNVVKKVRHVVKKVARHVKVKVHVSAKHCNCTPKKIIIKHNKVVVIKKPVIQRSWRAFRHCVVHWKLLTVGSKAWTSRGWVKGMRKLKIPKKVPMNAHKAYKLALKQKVATGMKTLKAKIPKKKAVTEIKKDLKIVEAKKHMIKPTKAMMKKAKVSKKHAKKSHSKINIKLAKKIAMKGKKVTMKGK